MRIGDREPGNCVEMRKIQTSKTGGWFDPGGCVQSMVKKRVAMYKLWLVWSLNMTTETWASGSAI